EEPPMVAAAYPLLADEPKLERGAAVRTMQLQETDGTAQVAERHQLLSQDLDPMREVAQINGEADRLPKAAHVFAAWRAGADMGEFSILVGDIAMEISAQSRLQEPGFGGHGSPPFNDRRKERVFTVKPPRARSMIYLKPIGRELRDNVGTRVSSYDRNLVRVVPALKKPRRLRLPYRIEA